MTRSIGALCGLISDEFPSVGLDAIAATLLVPSWGAVHEPSDWQYHVPLLVVHYWDDLSADAKLVVFWHALGAVERFGKSEARDE